MRFLDTAGKLKCEIEMREGGNGEIIGERKREETGAGESVNGSMMHIYTYRVKCTIYTYRVKCTMWAEDGEEVGSKNGA
jgi:hypothetical protein